MWTSFVLILLGLWQIGTMLTFADAASSLYTSDIICGVLLILCGCYLRTRSLCWATWFVAFIGVWLQLSPLIFWVAQPLVYLNDTLVGVLAILFSIILQPHRTSSFDGRGSIPPGWSYNPSAWTQRMPIVLLATVSWFIARYMAAYQLGFIDTIPDPFFGEGTWEVITSSVSRAFPVSDAGLGAAAYTLEAILACKGDERRWYTMPWMVVIFGILVVPLGLTSIILIIMQPLIVGFWCSFCLMTAICMVVMVALAVDEVVAVLQYLKRVCRQGKPFWQIFWKGGECIEAKIDRHAPESNAPFPHLLRAMTWGISPTWKLFFSGCFGVLLLVSPALFSLEQELADIDHILGALSITVSIVSMAEVIRSWRFINMAFGLVVGLSLFFVAGQATVAAIATHIVIALALIFLNLQQVRSPQQSLQSRAWWARKDKQD